MSNGARILVIDDEAIVRLSCRRALVPLGYEIVEATDGVEGLEKLKGEPFDLVLTDIKMPHMDGLDFALNMAKNHPGIKVILMTGYGTSDTAQRARQLGFNRYMEKPFTPEALSRLVKETLEG